MRVHLELFLRNITTPLILHLRKERGTQIFQGQLLRETKDLAYSFTGLNVCREASKFVYKELKSIDERGFVIASNETDGHHFILDQESDNSIIDPTWRQFLSYSVKRDVLLMMEHSKNPEVREAAIYYVRNGGGNFIKQSCPSEFVKSVEGHDIIFHGPLTELRERVEEIFGKRLSQDPSLPKVLGNAIITEILSFWGENSQTLVEAPTIEVPTAKVKEVTASSQASAQKSQKR